MLSVDEYRQRAHACLEKAQHALEHDRPKLEQLARCWFQLADDGVLMPSSPTLNFLKTGPGR
jgi:hypothetical protein